MTKIIIFAALILSISAFGGEREFSDDFNNLQIDASRYNSDFYKKCITETNRKHFRIEFDKCINKWKSDNNKEITNKTTPTGKYREELLNHATICQQQAISAIEQYRIDDNAYLRCNKYK